MECVQRDVQRWPIQPAITATTRSPQYVFMLSLQQYEIVWREAFLVLVRIQSRCVATHAISLLYASLCKASYYLCSFFPEFKHSGPFAVQYRLTFKKVLSTVCVTQVFNTPKEVCCGYSICCICNENAHSTTNKTLTLLLIHFTDN